MAEIITDIASEFWWVLTETGVWLVGGFLVAGLMHAFVSRRFLQQQLGRPGIRSVALATGIGVPLPLCSCSVIPMASALRRGGASRGASAAFAVSTPEIDVPAVSITWALLGWPIAVARVVGAAVSAMVAGVLIDLFSKPDDSGVPDVIEPVEASGSCCGSTEVVAEPCCGSEVAPKPSQKQSILSRFAGSLRFAVLDLPKDLAFWLLIGLGLTAVIGVLLPQGWIGEHVGGGFGSLLIALVVGVPVYVCATSSTPLAAALIANGLSPGAGLVFLLAGPATNPATIAWVYKDLGIRAMVLYLVAIASCALGAGWLLDALVVGGGVPAVETFTAHEHEAGLVAQIGGVALGVMLLLGLLRAGKSRFSWIGGGSGASESCCGSEAPEPQSKACCETPSACGCR